MVSTDIGLGLFWTTLYCSWSSENAQFTPGPSRTASWSSSPVITATAWIWMLSSARTVTSSQAWKFPWCTTHSSCCTPAVIPHTPGGSRLCRILSEPFPLSCALTKGQSPRKEFKWYFLTSHLAGQLLWQSTNLPPKCWSVICIFCNILQLSLKDVKSGISYLQ